MFYERARRIAVKQFEKMRFYDRCKICFLGCSRFLNRKQIIELYNSAVIPDKKIIWDEDEFCYSFMEFKDQIDPSRDISWIRNYYLLALFEELKSLRFLDAVSKAKAEYKDCFCHCL